MEMSQSPMSPHCTFKTVIAVTFKDSLVKFKQICMTISETASFAIKLDEFS